MTTGHVSGEERKQSAAGGSLSSIQAERNGGAAADEVERQPPIRS